MKHIVPALSLWIASTTVAPADDGYAFMSATCSPQGCSILSERTASTWTYRLPTLTRISAGIYRTQFPFYANEEEVNVQVSTDSSGATHCQVLSSQVFLGWDEVADIHVVCYSSSGVPMDTTFVVSISSQTDQGFGFGRAGYGETDVTMPGARYVPPDRYWFNSTAGAFYVGRTSQGKYKSTFGSWPDDSAIALVTGVGSPRAACKPTWIGPVSGATEVQLSCWAAASRLDSRWSIAAVDQNAFYMGNDDRVSGASNYSLCDPRYLATGASSSCFADMSWNNFGGTTPSVKRRATGRYTVTMDGGALMWSATARAFLVNAYGTDETQCHSAGWWTIAGTDDARLDVACNKGTAAADSRFVFVGMSDTEVYH